MVPVDGGAADVLLDNADDDAELGVAVVGATERTAGVAARCSVDAEQPTINARTAKAVTAGCGVLMGRRRWPGPVGCITAGHAAGINYDWSPRRRHGARKIRRGLLTCSIPRDARSRLRIHYRRSAVTAAPAIPTQRVSSATFGGGGSRSRSGRAVGLASGSSPTDSIVDDRLDQPLVPHVRGYLECAGRARRRTHARQLRRLPIPEVMDRAGIPGTPHALRQWFGTALREAGVDSVTCPEPLSRRLEVMLLARRTFVDAPIDQVRLKTCGPAREVLRGPTWRGRRGEPELR